MRALILLLAVLALPAEAMEIGRFQNEGGGAIVLTDGKCKAIEGANVAYAYVANGKMTTGCWAYFNGDVIVQYANGETRVYHLDGFKLNPDFVKKQGDGKDEQQM